ncbi:S-formylglutathione hydrolase [Rhizobium altiplani]|uniref:S-formylglutathione hydrolase n=2 Tax=Rhizobium altiplani TaxID=1864509 RepID=A0A109J8Z1_9HYPH|nr:S-formylglutathione hydrolase [Rhizobium altiplani]
MGHANSKNASLPSENRTVDNDGRQLVLDGCRKFGMRSAETGLDYEIFTYVPDTPPPRSGFPVIYVLDANSDFATVAETVRRVSRRPSATGISPSVVVGIGYPNTRNYDLDRRYLDFTRGVSADPTGADVPADGCGGQPAYIRFLARQLLPYVSDQFDIDPSHRVLLGHSLAGYFVLDLLAQCPEIFDSYISFSPSLWWDRPRLVETLKEQGAGKTALRLYVSVGRFEQELAPWQAAAGFNTGYQDLRAARRMIDNAREVADEIQATFAPDTDVRFEIGDQEDHSTIVTTTLCRALRFVDAGRIG